MKRSVLWIMLLASTSAEAQVQPSSGDPRIQTVDFRPDQVVRIDGAIGYQVTIELAPDEQIQTVAVGDTVSWSVSANKAGDRLFVKPIQGGGGTTNMLVVTTSRSYNFELVIGGGSSAYTMRFRYPSESPPSALTTANVVGHYRLDGDRRLWPIGVHDDGSRTFIDWPADVPLPAVYVIDGMGRELLANGYVRDGIYVIDGVERQLVFRIDRHVARASRYFRRKSKS